MYSYLIQLLARARHQEKQQEAAAWRAAHPDGSTRLSHRRPRHVAGPGRGAGPGAAAHAEGLPARAEGLPARASGVPVRAEGRPARASGVSARAEGLPARAPGSGDVYEPATSGRHEAPAFQDSLR